MAQETAPNLGDEFVDSDGVPVVPSGVWSEAISMAPNQEEIARLAETYGIGTYHTHVEAKHFYRQGKLEASEDRLSDYEKIAFYPASGQRTGIRIAGRVIRITQETDRHAANGPQIPLVFLKEVVEYDAQGNAKTMFQDPNQKAAIPLSEYKGEMTFYTQNSLPYPPAESTEAAA